MLLQQFSSRKLIFIAVSSIVFWLFLDKQLISSSCSIFIRRSNRRAAEQSSGTAEYVGTGRLNMARLSGQLECSRNSTINSRHAHCRNLVAGISLHELHCRCPPWMHDVRGMFGPIDVVLVYFLFLTPFAS